MILCSFGLNHFGLDRFWLTNLLFIQYVRLLTHVVGSISWVMLPCLTISASLPSILSWYFWHLSSAMLDGRHIWILSDMVLTSHTLYLVERPGECSFQGFDVSYFLFLLFARPPNPFKVCWSLAAGMVLVNVSWPNLPSFRTATFTQSNIYYFSYILYLYRANWV